jgi:cobalt-zinc-cadmium efflux system outer membrane protein
VALGGPAGPPAGGGLAELSLPDAIRIALTRSPDSLSAAEDVRSAQGAELQAHAFSNPQIFVYRLAEDLSPFASPAPTQFGVTWTIPIGGKRGAGIAAASAAVAAAEGTRAAFQHQLAFNVETAFIAVLLDQSQLDFAKQDQQGLDQAVELDELRYKDGKIAYSDVLKLRIQARGADDTVRQDELAVSNDRSELARLLGQGVLAPDFRLVGTLAASPTGEALTASELYDRALANRADYKALGASEQSADSSLTRAERTPIPDLGVLVDYDQVPGSAGQIDFELSATIPLFDRNGGNIAQADAAHRKAGLAIETMRNQLRSDAEKAAATLQTSRQRLAVYDQDLLSEAKESLDISRHAYEQGRGSLLDFLDAESSYRDVERAYRSAVAGAMLAAAQVLFVAGEEPR